MTRLRWTPELEQAMRTHYAHTRTEDLARMLGLPLHKVLGKAWRMGLHKDRSLIAELARERSNAPGHPSQAHRWAPGHRPWNAGVAGSTGQHPNSRATQFRPGNKPHTWVPVGSLRLKDAVEIKYSDAPGPPSRRWMFLGRYLWEQAHGPVPKGHLVVFKAGRATTDPARITLDAVELITRRENMQRNTCHRLPKPLERVIQLRGVLTRAINRRAKDARETEEANV